MVFAARYNPNNPERTWAHWDWLAAQLQAAGYTVGIVGNREDTWKCPNVPCSWDFSNSLSAKESWIAHSDVVVGTDTTWVHFASILQKPVVEISIPKLVQKNIRNQSHCGCLINKGTRLIRDSWNNPEVVLQRLKEVLS